MPDPSKDFTPIRDDYEFFATQSDEAEQDLNAYAERLGTFAIPARPIRMLDFGCGPGTFTRRFLRRMGWGRDRLELTLVEPSAAYREQAVEHLGATSERPIRALNSLPDGEARAFDLILSNHVLYYVPELDATLGRIIGTLDRDGLFLTAIAGRDNSLVDLWYRSFAIIGRPVPYQDAEHVADALQRLGVPFEAAKVRYSLEFPDAEENRWSILRFLLGEHLAAMPRSRVLDLFEPYSVDGRVVMHTGNMQYYIRGSA